MTPLRRHELKYAALLIVGSLLAMAWLLCGCAFLLEGNNPDAWPKTEHRP